jgi:ABC-type transporter Mla subunit MlaD
MPKYPRINVPVSQEQYELLSRLAALDPDLRSSASFLRQLLDQVTPLLRVTVPMMQTASEEMKSSREQLREPYRNFIAAVSQMELLDDTPPQAARTERSDGVRPGRKHRAASK